MEPTLKVWKFKSLKVWNIVRLTIESDLSKIGPDPDLSWMSITSPVNWLHSFQIWANPEFWGREELKRWRRQWRVFKVHCKQKFSASALNFYLHWTLKTFTSISTGPGVQELEQDDGTGGWALTTIILETRPWKNFSPSNQCGSSFSLLISTINTYWASHIFHICFSPAFRYLIFSYA